MPDSGYPFHDIWEGSFESPTGYEHSQNVLSPCDITFLDNAVEQPAAYAVATPNLWGLADIPLQDKALNRKDCAFTEIVEFTI